jgi:hypothetical protein
MHLWLIPMIYVGASAACGMVLPRIEQAYFASYTLDLSVASAQAYLSAVASGMMAITGIVFAMAFVMVQFSAIAYSPRLVLWFARDHTLFHSLGAFVATFIYALCTLAWVDRGGSGTVPLFSSLLVGVLLIVSMLLFSRLVQRLADLQITSVLHLIGEKGREVIRDVFHRFDGKPATGVDLARQAAASAQQKPATQTLKYSGAPRTIAKLDIEALVLMAQTPPFRRLAVRAIEPSAWHRDLDRPERASQRTRPAAMAGARDARSSFTAGHLASPVTRACQYSVELAADQLFDEPTCPRPYLGLDRVKPVVEKINSHLGRRLQRLRLRGNVRHGVVSSPTLQRRMIRG